MRADHELQHLFVRHARGRGKAVHLLASALVAGCRLWTFDRSLAAAARNLDLATAP